MGEDDPHKCTLDAWQGWDWSVWFTRDILIACYDSSYTAWNRKTGKQFASRHTLEHVKAAIRLSPDTIGETYATSYY